MDKPEELIGINVFVEKGRTAGELVPDVESAGLVEAHPMDEIGAILGKVAANETIAEIAKVPGVSSTELQPKRHLIE